MRFRALGRTGVDVSMLGLGCMRFPSEEETCRIVDECVRQGINYFETSPGYGDSELWLGKALLGKDRRKVMVSTKSSPIDVTCQTADQVRRRIEDSLKRLQTDYLDFYHAWSINSPQQYQIMMTKGGWLEGVLKARDEGLIRHVGMTSHSTPQHISEILNEGIFEVLTVQYSLILQSYRDCIRQAAGRGVGVILMGPLAGGLLCDPSPVLARSFAPDDQVTGAFKYVLSDPNVSVALSGMTSAKQVAENCARIDALPADLAMSYQDRANEQINAMLGETVGQFETVLCGGCRYCVNACPRGLSPFNIFKSYNMAMLGGQPAWSARMQASAEALLLKCTRCGKCEVICPQKINVPRHMERVKAHFEKQSGRN
ncbi:MAG: aldo/keto reductase [Phycisphaerae bacterium]|jgi:hypothetical protein